MRNERGFALIELAASMPALATLLVAMAAVFAWNVRSFACLVGDWEMQRQVQRVMQCVAMDAQYAEAYALQGGQLVIRKADDVVTYRPKSHDSPVVYRETLNGSVQPVNGETAMCVLRPLDLDCAAVDAHTLALRCRAVNGQTGHSYELQTAVTLCGATGGGP